MKLKKYVAFLLALVMLLGILASCGAKGQTLLKLEKEKITVNTFFLFSQILYQNLFYVDLTADLLFKEFLLPGNQFIYITSNCSTP